MRRIALAVLVPALLVGGCGGSGDTSDGSASAILADLESLRPGEILIRGLRTRVAGPYELRPGGYVVSFEQPAGIGDKGRLVVSLERRVDAPADPQRVLVDTRKSSGTAEVAMSGTVYVHIRNAGDSYVLRFTPKKNR